MKIISHPDDINGLILAWARANVLGELFFPLKHCERYHDHWKAMGTNSLKAGGWPPPDES